MAQAVSEFQSLLGALAEELRAKIERLLSNLSQLDQAELLAFITDAAPEVLQPFIAAAADLTAIWYEDQNPDSGFTATPAPAPTADDIAKTARWAVLQPDPAAAFSGAATELLFDASRNTVVDNAEREGVKWARFAREEACGFCRMLSVRGYFYKSEKSAKAVQHQDAAGHTHCNCVAFPDRGQGAATSDFIKKYEPILKQWKRDYNAARKIAGGNAGSIANAMDYLPGGRRYKGDNAPPQEPRRDKPINLDSPTTPPVNQPTPAADTAESDAAAAARLLPGLEKSLADLRARGLPEDSPEIQYHLTTIARLRRQLAGARR